MFSEIILTEKTLEILKANKLHQKLEDLKKINGYQIYLDKDEFPEWMEFSKVLHIEVIMIYLFYFKLRKWADLLLLAPLSANTLAKITNGICDNLLVNKCTILKVC